MTDKEGHSLITDELRELERQMKAACLAMQRIKDTLAK